MDKIIVYMLTTLDNPFNPFTEFDKWLEFDTEKGYNTLNYIARFAHISDELSEADEIEENNSAINKVLELNIYGNFVKITKETFKDLIKQKSLQMS